MTKTNKPARKGFVLVPCHGAAHESAHIDNCYQCAPRWGWVEVHIDTLRYASACADIARAKAAASTADGALVSLADELDAMTKGGV